MNSSTIAKNIQYNHRLQARKNSALPTAAFVLGLVSFLTTLFYYISLPAGILAIVFGVKSIKSLGSRLGKAGLILGILGVVFCVLIYGILVSLTLLAEL
ncbi:hypothetical protein IJI72_01710 [Candidatus Saccharibacteria bacterium]|nr:hypothetical protein [Candidatus Saccharibacteria bacterium]